VCSYRKTAGQENTVNTIIVLVIAAVICGAFGYLVSAVISRRQS
jgi:hypothetical protein